MLQGIPALIAPRGIKTTFTFFRAITIDKVYIGSDLTDFPVVVTGTFSYLKTVANGGKVKNASGYDIVFYSDAALTTKLKFERVYWSATTGEVEFWVKIPTVATASNTVFYMSYGNPAIGTDQADPENVWRSEFKGVWHFPDGTTTSYLDSTSNNIDGTNVLTTTAAGKFKGGVQGSTNHYVDMGDNLDAGTGNLTVSIWCKSASVGVGGYLMSKRSSATGASTPGWHFVGGASTSSYICDGSASRIQITATGTSVTDTQWHLCTAVFERASTARIYIDGALGTGGSGDITSQQGSIDGTDSLRIGAQGDLAAAEWPGEMDEARVYFGVQSVDWIAAEYANQNGVVSFYTISNENII